MSSPSPRPILKRSPTPSHRPHAVHFPPSPSLTTHTFAVYSAAVYDRSPIVVGPNSCALPERGCPGRTYTIEEDAPSIPNRYPYAGRERHPRALPSRQDRDRSPRRLIAPVPPLIPDLSSESDESDSFLHTPLETSSIHHLHGLAIPQEKYQTIDDQFCAYRPISSSALSFLPHPPSSPSRTSYGYQPSSYDDDTHLAMPKRRRERKHDSSRSPDRIPRETAHLLPIVTATTKSRIAALSHQSSFGVEEDGCLGGF